MAELDNLHERIARAIEPNTWAGIDAMESTGREAPFLRQKSQGSLEAASRVVDVLVDIGLESLIAELRAEDAAKEDEGVVLGLA